MADRAAAVREASARLFARYDNHDATASRGAVAVACGELVALLPEAAAAIADVRTQALAALEGDNPAQARALIGAAFTALAAVLDGASPAPATTDDDTDAPRGAEEE